MKRQTLAILALSVAAIGSIATSQPTPSWSIDGQATGPALVLVAGTAGVGSTSTHGITTVISAAAMDDDYTEGSLSVNAEACFTAVAGTAGTLQPPSLRVIVFAVDEQSVGRVLQQPLPLCPARIGFPVEVFLNAICGEDVPCTLSHEANFERFGDAEEVHVDWTVEANVLDYGQNNPPSGADVTVTIQ